MPDAPDDAPPGDGLDLLKAQVERRSRSVPAPRNPRQLAEDQHDPAVAPTPPSESDTVGEGGATQPGGGPPPAPSRRPVARSRATNGRPARAPDLKGRPVTQPDEPLANLAVRVRRSLDDRLGDLIHSLRHDGVRTSKVELVELLLWELPAEPSAELRRRLANFRHHAPREEPL